MKQLKPRELAAVLVMVIAVSGGATYGLVVRPGAKLRALHAEQIEINKEGRGVSVADHARLKSAYDNLREEVAAIENVNGRAQDTAGLYELISQFTSELGLEVEQVSPRGGTAGAGGRTTRTLTVVVQGTYPKIAALIARIEQTGTFHRVRSVKVAPRNIAEPARLTAVIEAEFFRFDIPDTLTLLESTTPEAAP
ncbi:MAG: hypothetical protein CMJ18_14175 [Phycisphaeraceae bacterium]|nr:hypothetical protein [Phycisphaeraceae bacterium]